MEQLRHRLTNVSPQGERCSADQNTLTRSDLDDFVNCYFGGTSSVSSKKAGTEASPPNRRTFDKLSAGSFRKESDRFNPDQSRANRFERVESERSRCFSYDELTKRDKVNPDIFWLKDESLEDSANLAGLTQHARLP